MANLTHFVVSTNSSGSSERIPLKSWLRRNPEVLPHVDPSALTTHQLRNMLRRFGWQQVETDGDVLLIQPDMSNEEVGAYIAAVEAEEPSDENEDHRDFAFELEHQLRDFLISNLVSVPVNGKCLKIFRHETGRVGREYPTAVGFIDVLAEDEMGALYVFELKRGRTSDHTVGQVLRYMGWCQQHLAQGRPVYGVIVALSHDNKLKFAASIVPGLSIFEYEISFKLRAVSLTSS